MQDRNGKQYHVKLVESESFGPSTAEIIENYLESEFANGYQFEFMSAISGANIFVITKQIEAE
jgi:hypothetical protein